MERQQNDTLANARIPARAPMGGAVPAALRYDVGQVEGLPAQRAMRRYYSSTGGTFSPANPTIRIDIGSQNYLDLNSALLCFSITNSSGAAMNADGGAACCIERLRVLSAQGQVLESIDHYNLWAVTTAQFTSTQEANDAMSILAQGPIDVGDNTSSGQWADDSDALTSSCTMPNSSRTCSRVCSNSLLSSAIHSTASVAACNSGGRMLASSSHSASPTPACSAGACSTGACASSAHSASPTPAMGGRGIGSARNPSSSSTRRGKASPRTIPRRGFGPCRP